MANEQHRTIAFSIRTSTPGQVRTTSLSVPLENAVHNGALTDDATDALNLAIGKLTRALDTSNAQPTIPGMKEREAQA